MKKLTASIFATLTAIVAVSSANAEIASKGYVDNQVGAVTTSVNTALGGKQDTLSEAQMNAVNSGITSTQVAQIGTNTAALTGGAETEGTVAYKIVQATADLATTANLNTLQESVNDNTAALTGDAATTGTVANKIATATSDMLTKTEAGTTYAKQTSVTEALAGKADATAFNTLNNTVTNAETGLGATRTLAQQGVNDAAAAKTAADNAQNTANAAIPKPAGECAEAANKCVLTYNNTVYSWEVIERAEGEGASGGTPAAGGEGGETPAGI